MSETQTPRTGSLADLKDLAVSAGVAVTPDDAPRYEAKRDALGRSYATGRRKNAIARVWIKPGKGEISVNGKKVGTYFARPVLRMLITQPFLVADRYNQFDVYCTVTGGGLSGQAGALRHGISRALTYYEPGPARHPQGGGVPHPRQPRGRAQEVRPHEGASFVPVLQALIPSSGHEAAGRDLRVPPFFLYG